jgi:serine/threonine protein kinase
MIPSTLPLAIDELALSNRCLAFAQHYCALVDILSAAHKLGVIHRDLSHSNFFLRLDGNVFLNDWSCAAIVPCSVPLEGALQLAPDRLLDAYAQPQTYAPAAVDDLLMFVRTIFSRINAVDFSRVASCSKPDQLKRF